MEFNIGEASAKGFKALIDMGDTQRSSFVQKLLEYPIGHLPSYFAQELEGKFSLSQDTINNLLGTLVGLISAKENSDLSRDEFITEIQKALKKALGVPEIPAALINDLKKILNSESNFYTTIKARDLLSEHKNLLYSSRIITDVRPVFNDDGTLKLTASVISHTLRLKYFVGEDKKEIYLSIDEKDIKDLIKQLNRAADKENAIRSDFQTKLISFKRID